MNTYIVAVPTFHRPAQLRTVLSSLSEQVAAFNARSDDSTATILVIDNDPRGSGESTTASFDADYVREPAPGIAAVRNRALTTAAGATAIIFIDDDEVPCPGWLDTLVEMYRRTGADAVAGKVLTELPPTAPEWVVVSGAFTRPRRPRWTVDA